MKFISAEEFLKQDEDVQRVFTDYFDHKEMLFEDGSIYFGPFNCLYTTPLLTEGDLREFIEDKTGCYIDISHNSMDTCIQLCDKENEYPIGEWEWQYLNNDLLQVYWKAAVEIAEHETR